MGLRSHGHIWVTVASKENMQGSRYGGACKEDGKWGCRGECMSKTWEKIVIGPRETFGPMW